MTKGNITRILFGILFVFGGVFVLGYAFGLWESVIIKGWWTVFIIIPGIASMIYNGIRFWNVFMVLLGGYLLAQANGWLNNELYRRIAFATVLIGAGVWLLVGWIFKPKRFKTNTYNIHGKNAFDDNSFFNYSATFGGIEVVNNSRDLQGGRITTSFGGVEVDLSQAVVLRNIFIDVSSSFGGVEIKAPLNVNIVISGSPFLGSIENKTGRIYNQNLPTVTFRCNTAFGGVEIK